MKVCDTTPPSTPGWSPKVMGVVVAMLCAGIAMNRMFQALGMAMGPRAMFGNGMGTGVLHTSGKARSIPISWQLANIA